MKRLSGVVNYDLGDFALGITNRDRHHGIGHQTVIVVAQGMTHVAQFIGGAALTIESDIVTADRALVAGPSLDQRTVNAEVFAW